MEMVMGPPSLVSNCQPIQGQPVAMTKSIEC